jgi:hypothetical protein
MSQSGFRAAKSFAIANGSLLSLGFVSFDVLASKSATIADSLDRTHQERGQNAQVVARRPACRMGAFRHSSIRFRDSASHFA